MSASFWQDEFDGIWTLHRGLPGGHTWMMVGSHGHHEQLAGILQALPGTFKGSIYVLLLPEKTALPLEHALVAHNPRGVLVLGEDLAQGPDLEVPAQRHLCSSELTYLEGGSWTGWESALPLEGETGADLWASVCAQEGIPVVVRRPEHAAEAWKHWWATIPLSLQNLQC